LAILRTAWRDALERAACDLVTIVGEPGVGKSRLVAEFLDGLGARVVSGRCLPYGEGITYAPIVEVIKQLGTLPADPAAAAAIESMLGQGGVTSPEEIAWAFRKLLEQSAPLVVVFDDIHWGEENFLDLVEHVALLSTGAPLFLLCLARSELSERRPEWPVGLRLEPLPPDDVDKLLPLTLPDELRAAITRASGGNPLFVVEMLAAADAAGREVVVPPTLKALLAMRLDQLEPLERSVLERGAVEGELFHRGAVQALDPTDTPATPQLARLVRKQLIRPDTAQLPGEDGFRFRHLLIRDAAYDALPKAMRAELHQRFASWLDEHGADVVERDEIVGYHLEQAYHFGVELGSPNEVLAGRAADHLVAAARGARLRGDLSAAIRLFRRAAELDPTRRRELLPDLGEMLFELGELTQAAAVLDEALEEAHREGDERTRAVASVLRAHVASHRGESGVNVRTVIEAADEAANLLERFEHGAQLARVLEIGGHYRFSWATRRRQQPLRDAHTNSRLPQATSTLAVLASTGCSTR
jgi:predicted ATPase